jgi:hypothetical protein
MTWKNNFLFILKIGPVKYSIRSEGCNDPGRKAGCGRAVIRVNRKDLSRHRRGYNFVVLDAYSGAKKSML